MLFNAPDSKPFTYIQMSKLDGAMNCAKFATFVERVKANAKLRPILDSLEDER